MTRQPCRLPFTLNEAREVLAANAARVEYSDAFIDSDGVGVRKPELGSRALVWQPGVMDLDFRDIDDATRQAAMFMVLWSLGLDAGDAIKTARAIVAYWDVRDEGNMRVFDVRQPTTKEES